MHRFYELGNSYGESNSLDLSFASGLLSWMEPTALKKMMLLMFKVRFNSILIRFNSTLIRH